MRLDNLLKSVSKNSKKISVKGISFDSRRVQRKDVFFAINGNILLNIRDQFSLCFKLLAIIVMSKLFTIVNVFWSNILIINSCS